MMAAARTPTDPDSKADAALDQEIADLWADGFDTFDIAEALARDGHAIGEPAVCRVLRDQQDQRRSARTGRVRV